MSTQRRGFIGRRPRPHVGDIIAHRHDARVIREAMRFKGIGLVALAQRTRDVDPTGQGVSWQLLSFLASDAPWSRDTTTLESARLITLALDQVPGALFYEQTVKSRRRPRGPAAQ